MEKEKLAGSYHGKQETRGGDDVAESNFLFKRNQNPPLPSSWDAKPKLRPPPMEICGWGVVADMYVGENSDGELGSTDMFQGLQLRSEIHRLPLQRCLREKQLCLIVCFQIMLSMILGMSQHQKRQCTDNLSQMLPDLENALVEKKMPKENWL
ncbi:hypothetical protein D8674_032075 [Pyrus ussuriensis x Pyrus communis]|uniref:Uncharacterized protein n=1 Tax=Pyrus ussuriensis x Pyrus communis TaxID=2448454 RepID=A0A5N5F0Y4_9ROSA|nr:hypothetical protein D8674_032075 [Pyrus ussuriensis x Pyrus communis]